MKKVFLLIGICFSLNVFAAGNNYGHKSASGHAVKSTNNLEKEAAALSSATNWLKLVDHGDYRDSYQQAATYFKAKVTAGQWEAAIKQSRRPLGKILSRKVKMQQYTTSVPGAPQGQYVIIQFTTKFAKKPSAIETITPMLDKDGKWHVAGYYIN